MMPDEVDAIIVGSGINSLVCGALLARRGWRVAILERNTRPGGCIVSEELFPGYVHDLLSTSYPLFTSGPAYAELSRDLHGEGLEFVQNGYATGVIRPDGRFLAFKQDISDTVQRLNTACAGDGDTFGREAERLFGADAGLTFGLLGQDPYSWRTMREVVSVGMRRGVDGLAEFGARGIENLRRWSDRELRGELFRTALAPWPLHMGMGPDDACSALIGKTVFASIIANGIPLVRGGSAKIVEAFCRLIARHHGVVHVDTDVERILFDGARAVGVAANGQVWRARRAVVCNVTPTQLYGRLAPNAPAQWHKRAHAYRYGRGCMQIHFALSAPPSWPDSELAQVPLLHLAQSLEAVSMAVAQANNGFLPARPTLAISQPAAIDATRAPAGGAILWIQMQDMPATLTGDATGEIQVPADGKWNDAVRERMADRVQRLLEEVLPGFAATVVGRRAYSPADLESLNCNLVGGDPYSGICTPDQYFWLRPFSGVSGKRGHATPWSNVHHIGASTHPGPGLAGGSGWMVAKRLLR